MPSTQSGPHGPGGPEPRSTAPCPFTPSSFHEGNLHARRLRQLPHRRRGVRSDHDRSGTRPSVRRRADLLRQQLDRTRTPFPSGTGQGGGGVRGSPRRDRPALGGGAGGRRPPRPRSRAGLDTSRDPDRTRPRGPGDPRARRKGHADRPLRPSGRAAGTGGLPVQAVRPPQRRIGPDGARRHPRPASARAGCGGPRRPCGAGAGRGEVPQEVGQGCQAHQDADARRRTARARHRKPQRRSVRHLRQRTAGPREHRWGHQYNAPHFEGDNTGVQFTAGDNSGTVHQRFERERRRSDDGR